MSRFTGTPVVKQDKGPEYAWSELPSDVVGVVFSKLPEACVVRAASVCKRWQSVIEVPTFPGFYTSNSNFRNRFIFTVDGIKCLFTEHPDLGFLFEPVEKWYSVPTVSSPEDGVIHTTDTTGGLHLAFTGLSQTTVRYKVCLFEKNWRVTPKMPYVVQDPIVGVVTHTTPDDRSFRKLIFVGGVPFQVEGDDDLAVSIYDEQSDSWQGCDPLPSEFRGSSSSFFMASVVHKGQFYAYDMYSGFVSRLDLESKQWSTVKVLRNAAAHAKVFLVSRSEGLSLVGVQDTFQRNMYMHLCFNVWNIVDESEETMRVGDLVHSSVVRIQNDHGASTTMGIMRWASLSLKILSTAVGITLILLVEIVVFCHSVTRRISWIMKNQLGLANFHYVCNLPSSNPARLERRPLTSGRIDRSGRRQLDRSHPSYAFHI